MAAKKKAVKTKTVPKKKRATKKSLRAGITDASGLGLVDGGVDANAEETPNAWVEQKGDTITFTGTRREADENSFSDFAGFIDASSSGATLKLRFDTRENAVAAYNAMFNDGLGGVDELMPDDTGWKSEETDQLEGSL